MPSSLKNWLNYSVTPGQDGGWRAADPTSFGEALRIPHEELENVDEIANILKSEKCTVAKWIECALAYKASGKPEHFESVCLAAESDAASDDDRVRVLNCLAASFITHARRRGVSAKIKTRA